MLKLFQLWSSNIFVLNYENNSYSNVEFMPVLIQVFVMSMSPRSPPAHWV